MINLFTSALGMILMLSVQAFSQNVNWSTTSSKAKKHIERARKFYEQRQDDEAVRELESALKADSLFVEAWVMKSEIHAEHKELKKAIECGKKAIQINPTFYPSIVFNTAIWEHESGLYSDAYDHLEVFLKLPKLKAESIAKGMELKKHVSFAKKAVKNPVPFKPVNLGNGVNADTDEYFPSLTADGEELIYTVLLGSGKEQQKDLRKLNEDFYSAKKTPQGWQGRKNMGGPVNTEGNEGAQSVSADGQFLFFTACQEYGTYPGNRKGFGSCDIFFSRRTGKEWSKPVNAGEPVSSNAWDSQPSFASNGKTLYFVSNRQGGKGGSDIWKSTIAADGRWSNPVNLGDSVNTPYDEESPFIHPDGTTLFFSSSGWPGMGGKDLFKTSLKPSGQFGTPVNLGYPINTSSDERDIMVEASGVAAYFSSKRENGFGGLDLYSFELPESLRPTQVSYLKGSITDATTGMPVEALITLTDLSTGQEIASIRSRPQNGAYLVCLPAGAEYMLNVSAKGYLFQSRHFELKNKLNNEPHYEDVKLNSIRKGEKIILNNIFFRTASFELEDKSKLELNKLLSLLKENKINVEISGHTDNVGDDRTNQLLSENRAKSVVDFLVKAGVESTRLKAAGFGSKRPVATNDTEEGRAKNRRTEFEIID